MSRFAIACGGTGGHLAPGIALAEALLARGHEAVLLISQKDIDARLSAKYSGLRFVRIAGAPLAWSPVKLARFLAQQLRGLLDGWRFVRRERPDAIVGFGGFTTAGYLAAGVLCGVPVALHEANRVPGKAVRTLARLARRVYLPPGVTLRRLRETKLRHVGLPVRREIQRLPRLVACTALGLDPARRVVVVLGGSQGAAPLNAWVGHHAADLAAAGAQVYCVTGPGKIAGVAPGAVFVPFSDRVAELFSAADLVVSRAGAGTIAELIRCGVPAVLVPYPHAADNHQWANARWFAGQGGGSVIDQAEIGKLLPEVRALLADEARLTACRARLTELGRTAAVDELADDLEELVHRPPSPAHATGVLA